MLSKYATIVGLAVALLGLTATLAPAVELTCSQVSEVWVGQPRAGSPMRTTCVMAKGPDGQEVPVTVLDSRMGEKLHCTEKGGRFAEITCPNSPFGAFGTRSTWYVPTPGLFRTRDVKPAWMGQ